LVSGYEYIEMSMCVKKDLEEGLAVELLEGWRTAAGL